jgi:hypothetical protein
MNRYAVFESSNNLAYFVEIASSWTKDLDSYFKVYAPEIKNWIEITAEDFSNLNNRELYPNLWYWSDITNIYNPLSLQVSTLKNLIGVNLSYNTNLSFKKDTQFYNTGIQVNTLNLFNNFHDLTINKGTCFILTSAITLKQIFEPPLKVNFGQLPGTFKITPRNSNLYEIGYNTVYNLFSVSLTGDVFHISPIPNTNEVELLVNNQYVQVQKEYPYNVVLNDYSLKEEEIYRQRFFCNVDNNNISFRTLTDSGFRYLTLTSNNILRATGLMLNDSIVNDYIFNYKLITSSSLETNFDLENHWVTYFNDYEIGTENTSVTINKNFIDVPVNYLVSFSIDEAIKTGKATVNISNLKTLLTPTGAAASTDNFYSKTFID